jgi:hypothetical protein
MANTCLAVAARGSRSPRWRATLRDYRLVAGAVPQGLLLCYRFGGHDEGPDPDALLHGFRLAVSRLRREGWLKKAFECHGAKKRC